MTRRKATWGNKTFYLFSFISVVSTIVLPYGYLLSIPLILIIVYQLLLRMIFRSPSIRSPVLSDPGWIPIKVENMGSSAHAFGNFKNHETDLVVFVHGWQSSSAKFIDRMKIFDDNDLHTLSIDMKGHGISPDTSEWTAGKVISDLKAILESLETSNIRKVHFYGHSLGGFVCIGMHNNRHEGWWKERYGTLMLESPMVAYSPIIEEMSGKLSFLLPFLKKWALKGFNKIHPEVEGLEWKDIDIPSWGLPKVPILLLQAANDSRLGRYHYDLLLRQDLDIYPHLLETLGHSKNRINVERDDLIRQWIEDRIN